jgi:glycosyltransferase involved in cell wall biosynthesis
VSSSIELSIVAPCYNEEAGISEFARRVLAVCESMALRRYELVLVNDGSRDATWSRIRDLAASRPEVVGINLSRNHGHQLALSAGLALCKGDRILIIDADLQDPPELLPRLMERMDQGADVVFGQRSERRGESAFKLVSARYFYRLLSVMTDVQIPVDTGDFRLMTRKALDVLLSMPEQHRFIRGMVSWIGMRQVPIEYVRDARFAGETKYPVRKMVRFALDAITGFSTKPLRVASYAGAAFAAFGFAIMMNTGYEWYTHRTVRGWTSLMGVVLMMGSVQLLVLGVIGEYLGRLYIEAKRRPLFVIESVVRHNGDTMVEF